MHKNKLKTADATKNVTCKHKNKDTERDKSKAVQPRFESPLLTEEDKLKFLWWRFLHHRVKPGKKKKRANVTGPFPNPKGLSWYAQPIGVEDLPTAEPYRDLDWYFDFRELEKRRADLEEPQNGQPCPRKVIIITSEHLLLNRGI